MKTKTIKFDGTIAPLKEAIEEMEKSISLRQIHVQSGVNYITLMNIKKDKQGRVTSKVANRIKKFYQHFDPSKAQEAAPARGRKSKTPTQPSSRKTTKTTSKKFQMPKGYSLDSILNVDCDPLIRQREEEIDLLRQIKVAQQGLQKTISVRA